MTVELSGQFAPGALPAEVRRSDLSWAGLQPALAGRGFGAAVSDARHSFLEQ
jgi:hypothetical protein